MDDSSAPDFYRAVLTTLNEADMPFLVGGAYALSHFTGVRRQTKDLDVFIRREDYEKIAKTLARAGYETEMSFPHWLAKAYSGRAYFVDLIFSSGNGIATVDDAWFRHAVSAKVLDVPVRICPVEETIWSKAFIMERERYDGADIAHLLRACAHDIDWHRLRKRFASNWRVLLSHLTLFGFVYPGHRDLIPAWLLDDLVERLQDDMRSEAMDRRICAGTLLSREQYLNDIEEQGYADARLQPLGSMTAAERAAWTEAISRKGDDASASST